MEVYSVRITCADYTAKISLSVSKALCLSAKLNISGGRANNAAFPLMAATHKEKTFFTAEDAEENPHALPLRPPRPSQ
ncbi:MAG: hypothetical protein WC091_24140 [Sulfuricellaceae bacterium]